MMGQDNTGFRVHSIPQSFDTFAQEKQHGIIIILTAAIRAAIKYVTNWINYQDVDTALSHCSLQCLNDLFHPIVIEYQS